MTGPAPKQSASSAAPDDGAATGREHTVDESSDTPGPEHDAPRRGRDTWQFIRNLDWARFYESTSDTAARIFRSVKQFGLGRMLYFGVLTLVILVIYETIMPGKRFEVEPIGILSPHATIRYEPAVAAQHLIDEIHNIMLTAQAIARHHTDPIIGETTVDEGPDNEALRITVRTTGSASVMELPPRLSTFTSEEYGPDFTVPAVAISLKGTAAYLRALFGLSRRITADLMFVEPADNVELRVRIDGQPIPRTCAMDKQGTIQQVFHYGAQELLCTIEPVTLAAYFYATRELSLVRKFITVARANHTGAELLAQALLLEGHLDAVEGRLDDAIAKYSRAIRHHSTSVQAYTAWGDALWANGSFEEAIEKYGQALATDSAFAPAYIGWGHALYAQEDYTGAIEKLSQAIENNPISVLAYTLTGNALRANGKYSEAIEKYGQALAIDSTFARAYTGWGNALYVQGEYDDAIEQYQRAIEHNPSYFIAYYNWGNVLRAKQEYEEAISKYALAAEHNPQFGRVYRAWGETLCAMGDKAAATDKFARAGDLGVESPTTCSDD